MQLITVAPTSTNGPDACTRTRASCRIKSLPFFFFLFVTRSSTDALIERGEKHVGLQCQARRRLGWPKESSQNHKIKQLSNIRQVRVLERPFSFGQWLLLLWSLPPLPRRIGVERFSIFLSLQMFHVT